MNRENIKWNALVDAIDQERCVLCIGPGVFTNRKGEKLEDQFLTYLQENGELDNDIICYPDGLFYFRRESKRNNVLSDFSRFLKGEFPELDAVYKKLIKIPFNLILFLTPDQRYARLAKEEGMPVNTDFYFKKQPPRIKEAPTKSFPIAYNLFGSFQDDESIVLTYDDLFDFIQSIFAEKSMSGNMRSAIQQAKHFVCLGLPFEKWYMQLLLRILEIHTNKRLTKYAANSQVHETQIKSFFEDQFDITFVEGKVVDFVDRAFDICQQNNLIRKQSDATQSKKERILSFVANNKLEDAIKELEKTLVDEKRLGNTIADQIAHIKRRMRLLKQERTKGVINTDVYFTETTIIADNILQVLNANF